MRLLLLDFTVHVNTSPSSKSKKIIYLVSFFSVVLHIYIPNSVESVKYCTSAALILFEHWVYCHRSGKQIMKF